MLSGQTTPDELEELFRYNDALIRSLIIRRETQSLKSHYWLRVLKKNVRVKLNVKKHNTLKTLLKHKENINGTFYRRRKSSAALQLRTLRTSTTKISTL